MASIVAEIRPHWGNWRLGFSFLVGRLGFRSYSVQARESENEDAVDVAAVAQDSTRATIAALRADIVRLIDQVRDLADKNQLLTLENDALREENDALRRGKAP